MKFTDVLVLAWQSIKNNPLRTAITVAIITFGLTALIGILTAIEAMKIKMKEGFSMMGANSFVIKSKENKINLGGSTTSIQRKENASSNISFPPISYDEALAFKQQFVFPATVSITTNKQKTVTIKYKNKSTNPNVNLISSDENYITVNGFAIISGRNFTEQEANAGHNVCLIGQDIVSKFFQSQNENAINEFIYIDDHLMQIVGVLKSKGTGAFFSFDNLVISNIKATQTILNSKNFNIGIMVNEVHQVDAAMNESKGLFKAIRQIKFLNEPNFVLEKSDRLATIFINASQTITFAAIAIGLITLFGAAIGLMNIMLVTVNERTKEVGLIKAIGGANKSIKIQFILESVIIAILGAIIGVLLGILIGNLVGHYLQIPFFVPWNWVLLGIVLCTSSGLLAGIYPAIKASRLNPIQALRYE